MTVNVYWSNLEEEWILAKEPESISKKLFSSFKKDKNDINASPSFCPATNSYLKNIYGLSSLYDYEFKIEKGRVLSENYNQQFFENHVLIRDLNKKFFSFRQQYIFFVEEKSLNMQTYLPPFLENNYFSSSCFSIPGEYDIGKWFRPLEFAFVMRKDVDNFKINFEDIYTYIKFDTDKKIKFKKFVPTEKIKMFANAGSNISSKPIGMQKYYSLLTHKKNIIKEIKDNLIE